MSFFQDFNKIKKQHDILEMNELHPNDGESQINKMSQIAQSRISNFDQVYNYLQEEVKIKIHILVYIIEELQVDGLDVCKNIIMQNRPTLVKEAMNDLDELLKIIKALQNMQIIKKTELQMRNQKVVRLQSVHQEMREKLQKMVDQLQSKQRQSISVAQHKAQNVADEKEFQLLQDSAMYDEYFVEKRQKQINEIAQVIYSLDQMMTDAALMIETQGQKIDDITGNIKSAANNVQQANKEVVKASGVQKGSGNRVVMFCIVLTFIIVIVVLMFRAGNSAKV